MVPFIVNVRVPLGACNLTFTVSVEEPELVTEVGLKLAVPLGTSTPELLVTRVVAPFLHTVNPVQTMYRLARSMGPARAATLPTKVMAIAAVDANHTHIFRI